MCKLWEMPTKITRVAPKIRTERDCFAKFCALSFPSKDNVLEKIGTNEAESAASANSCLDKLANV